MRILGVRAAPKVASFVVYCTEDRTLKCVDVIKIPLTLSTPEKLKYVRNNILDILREYNVSIACIRISESNSQNLNIERLYIEGVIQEAFSSSNVKSYYTLRKQGIYSRIGISAAEFEDAIKGKLKVRDIDTSSYDTSTNEAILAALAVGDA
ncbi:hypothetical protein [Yersinia kristensenii]|uniref:hypothetical protein n=1 Tax=Yersinia kristensenii TaxID=28152 RepID=UPI0005EA2192|nr:hypothetical protein [Yersinia kristensenii]CNG28120.1 Uncharacterised protein [Yersinia kristensenii]CNJ68757.1 Uncharacterised protein [Yersinia kristensenii]